MTEYIYSTDEHGGHWLTGEEIVRCRDCKYAEPEPPSDRRSRKKYQGGYWCDYWSEGIGAWCEPEGFCAWAERREET